MAIGALITRIGFGFPLDYNDIKEIVCGNLASNFQRSCRRCLLAWGAADVILIIVLLAKCQGLFKV